MIADWPALQTQYQIPVRQLRCHCCSYSIPLCYLIPQMHIGIHNWYCCCAGCYNNTKSLNKTPTKVSTKVSIICMGHNHFTHQVSTNLDHLTSHEILYTIWYHLYNLKNVKKVKVTLLQGCFSRFKLCKWYYITQRITNVLTRFSKDIKMFQVSNRP